MKKIIFLSAFLFSVAISFAQTEQSAKVASIETYNSQKFKDIFTFDLTEKVTQEHVAEVSKFYIKYFTTTFDEKRNSIVVKMANQDIGNRKIMRRLFAGLGVNTVSIDGKTLSVDEFFQEHVYTADQPTTK
jgi:hypothetical protein